MLSVLPSGILMNIGRQFPPPAVGNLFFHLLLGSACPAAGRQRSQTSLLSDNLILKHYQFRDIDPKNKI